MRTKILLFMTCLYAFAFTAAAQVKIGDNPNTINGNSLLEMETTNKGLLLPRVAINDVNSVSPLTGTVPAGMTVYSTGGTVANGFYCWNGSKWVQFQAARDNYVLVKSQSDFPAPVGGVITLTAGTVYEINGTITMTNKIDPNGSTIMGKNRNADKLLYTPTSGELFTGAHGGTFFNVTLSATGTGSKVFNLDAAGDITQVLLLEYVFIFDSYEVGVIKGFAGYVALNTVAYSNNINGMTLQDLGDFVALNEFWVADNQNTFRKMAGTFSTILISGGKMHVLSALSSKAMDVTGITSISTGAELKNVLFEGDGTYIVGTFSNKWEVESNGVNTEKDDGASGNIYISTTATTNFSAVNTPTKVLGTTTAANLFRVTSPSNNRITYIGAKKKRFQVICSLSLNAAGSNKFFSFYVTKNGSTLPQSKQMLKMGTSSDKGSITLSCTVELATNEYVEIWVENNTDATSLVVESFNLAIK